MHDSTASETIFALSTGPSAGALAVIRVSGWKSADVLANLSKRELPTYRYAALRWLYDPETNQPLDQALVLRFAEGMSFTGEETVELQVHGSHLTVLSISNALETLGCRLAEPGEFSRRAVKNRKMSLAEAEGLSSLIASETDAQHRHALRLMNGAVGDLVGGWHKQLVSALALLETSIDFVDEDIDVDLQRTVYAALETMRRETEKHQEMIPVDNLALERPRVAFLGPPNAGKSSLINAVAGEDLAIVSAVPGTTRDAVRAQLTIEGCDIELVDTAGLRDDADEIEQIGIERAEDIAATADVRIFVGSSDTEDSFRSLADRICDADAVLWSKQDMDPMVPDWVKALPSRGVWTAMAETTSARRAIQSILGSVPSLGRSVMSPISGSKRRERLLAAFNEDLKRACDAVSARQTEIASAELRGASQRLSALIGSVDNEDILDEVFSSFCIGK